MAYIPFAVAILVLGFLLWRADRRFDEAQRAWRLERVGLLTRIQSPELAAVVGSPEPTGELLHLPMDDDRAFEQYQEDREAGLVN